MLIGHDGKTGNGQVDVSEALYESADAPALNRGANQSDHHKDKANLALIESESSMTHLGEDHRHDREPGDTDEINERNDSKAPATGFLEGLFQIGWTALPRRVPVGFRKDESTSEPHWRSIRQLRTKTVR